MIPVALFRAKSHPFSNETAMPTRSLVNSNVSDQIFELLRRAIVAGEFSPGTPLRENELAKKFDVKP